MNPVGYEASEAWGAGDHVVLGNASLPTDHQWHAYMWDLTSGTGLDMHPNGYRISSLVASSGEYQVGYGVNTSTGRYQPLLWHGSAETAVSLLDPWVQGYATGIWGGTQVGRIDGPAHAVLWHGSAASMLDLNPSGYTQSAAKAIADGQIVGYGEIAGGTQVPLAWTSESAGSAVSLLPQWGRWGYAGAVSHGYQVGIVVDTNYKYRAVLWHGTAESVVDLTALLPPEYLTSPLYATGIAVQGDRIDIVGDAYNSTTYQRDYLLWSYNPVPEPAPLSVAVVGIVGFLARRRPRSRAA